MARTKPILTTSPPPRFRFGRRSGSGRQGGIPRMPRRKAVGRLAFDEAFDRKNVFWDPIRPVDTCCTPQVAEWGGSESHRVCAPFDTPL